jgi:hypothetical protein
LKFEHSKSLTQNFIAMIQVNGNTLGFDEVVDTLDDALVVVEKVQTALSDGIGLSDIATLFEITPRLNEIKNDASTFAAQFTDLTPEESEEVAAQLVARRGGSSSVIVDKALGALHLAARWHGAVAQVVGLVDDTVDYGKGIFKKAPTAEA